MHSKRAGNLTPITTMELERIYRLLFLAILVNVARQTQARFLPGPWIYAAHATFYGTEDALATMGGACGYGNLYQSGYGTATTALSSVLFKNGLGCGGCYQIRCVNSKYCYRGNPSVTVTATNLCPANWARPTNDGGWCNPPREHFDMSKPVFMKIAFWRAGIVPVAYRRVPCLKEGGIRFNLQGNYWWLLVYITNVGGPGDISRVHVKGSRTGWIPMTRNWGAAFQVFHSFQGQSISFMITAASTRETIIAWNVAPRWWRQGAIYSGGQLR